MNEEKRITRGKAIRLKCLDCCCGNSAEVRRCELKKCPLWPYRMGNEKKAQILQDANENEGNQRKGYKHTTPNRKTEIQPSTRTANGAESIL